MHVMSDTQRTNRAHGETANKTGACFRQQQSLIQVLTWLGPCPNLQQRALTTQAAVKRPPIAHVHIHNHESSSTPTKAPVAWRLRLIAWTGQQD